MVIIGPPGVGKSSMAGNIPGAVALPFAQENTWSLLKKSGAVPADLPTLPPVESWTDMLSMMDSLATGEHDYKALVVDTLGCAERLCHEHVCVTQLGGDWGERGFCGFQRGYEISLPEWRNLLNAFDRLRDQRKMRIILLGHTKISPYKNPIGNDYDRFVCDIHHKTWSLTHRWADAVLFANYFVIVEDKKGSRSKASGGQERNIYTEHDASYDAKNRFGLPAEIPMGESGKEAWNNFVAALTETRKRQAA